MDYFTEQDIDDLCVAFDMCKGKSGISVAEIYNDELLELTDEEIKCIMISYGVKPPYNLGIIRGDGFIELILN